MNFSRIENPDANISKFADSPLAKEAKNKTFSNEGNYYERSLAKTADVQKKDIGESPEISKKELIEDYYDDLKKNSDCPETIDDIYRKWEKQSPEAVAEKRTEFNNNKENLIKSWEEKNVRDWPCYEEDVYSPSGKPIRAKGDRYDAHHIQPLSQGGENNAGNITPIHASNHFDKQGIHSPDSPYGKIEKISQGGQS
ncbi:MAG: hypothetical protein LBQ58_06040 [Synergistaceae bacterium]|jgi:hypothetical protein|nr:hypothetical protein [Synergistaceae bacterium]